MLRSVIKSMMMMMIIIIIIIIIAGKCSTDSLKGSYTWNITHHTESPAV
jgi:amino acid permease